MQNVEHEVRLIKMEAHVEAITKTMKEVMNINKKCKNPNTQMISMFEVFIEQLDHALGVDDGS